MYLRKLEIVGFKSFLNKTTLHFEPGITAVVGPNGCGKSNIFDSMRWVLGEQSVKSLRGSDMQDVIFGGTDTKEPLGMAEVSLAFDNTGKFFPVEYDEVVVTRRIFRSGESEYLLNKSVVRLKDILDLLMGTGIGAESYSLVQQGKIDLVLSSKPEERRMVFDEAAGITKYKSQKREALRRLEETEQNLLRVNDIIIEVRRQIGSLERQANKARRYKETFEELKAKEMTLALDQKKQLLTEKDEIINQLSELEAKEAELLKIIQEEETGISNRQSEIRALEDNIMHLRNQILNLNNLLVRNNSRTDFNQEKIAELEANKKYLESQIEQVLARLSADVDKLNNVRQEYEEIKNNIAEKSAFLKDKESRLNNLNASIHASLENISRSKKNILDLVAKIANTKNEVTASSSQEQVYLARKKRLELERAKLSEEKALVLESLDNAAKELDILDEELDEISLKIDNFKKESDSENLMLGQLKSEIDNLERRHSALLSQKEFLENLKARYEDISESLNAVIYLDKTPSVAANGLVIRIKSQEEGNKFLGEAKPIDLDAQKINALIAETEAKIRILSENKTGREKRIEELTKVISDEQESLRAQEIKIANKKTLYDGIQAQFNKLKEEDEIIGLELSDLNQELITLEGRLTLFNRLLGDLEKQNHQQESLITSEQNNISLNSKLKEEAIVIITQLKTELKGLNERFSAHESNFKSAESAYAQDQEALLNLETQISALANKKEALEAEIKAIGEENILVAQDIEQQDSLLKEEEAKYRGISSGAGEVMKKIEAHRSDLDGYKNQLYELQMRDKDIDFKYLSMKERLSQAYKVELDSLNALDEAIDPGAILEEIRALKDKVDAYGSVNLVAIEEYDELKKRYDFLNQQQADLISAKDSLHEAILKINRTTKKMFVETFEKVRAEFRNYFRLLFNGGDAQLFLIDEEDPLESGIEIICRPPGKKLQNVLLLSGGEKSMAAIALIFAIFKVKPSPFCVLDEIDAALDEANVDRFSRILQEFAATSQFIVITHNKRTIANADVMYGITMEESGVSKIVSVKFAQSKAAVDKENAPVA